MKVIGEISFMSKEEEDKPTFNYPQIGYVLNPIEFDARGILMADDEDSKQTISMCCQHNYCGLCSILNCRHDCHKNGL